MKSLKYPMKKIIEWSFNNRTDFGPELAVYRVFHNYDYFKNKYKFDFTVINSKYGNWNNNKVYNYYY